ncbi:MAG: hypothetical protein E5V79_00820 [Mesorhizobium sp.]|uniref:hypothetical protein n=1 Tax=Mesorhizobium sp. M2A.F.Ca.ET.043.05.1.1 TaxID=2493671 RepID=UPI000F74E612|nr:hypothetical protein [Mesorhizobium sp. M2A.F.Ca.ET.043.05.1.1]AZO17046.1 hypothetical protein EJ069_21450 [Mesorhizobium sp. M2A.F.Ca.ET.043.05.1.1]TIV75632.1 MAG: hypothetical protein E5V79_00820 [Mesorhizobium sp.]
MAVDYGLISISFFGPDGSTQSYIEPDGTMRYERGKSGAEFQYEVILSADRTVKLRVVAFDHSRPLDALEIDAKGQLKRMLQALGKVGDEMEVSAKT